MQSATVLDTVWQSLEEATTRRTGFTLGYLGTVDEDNQPQVRAVILRRFDTERHYLLIATNAHSAKVAEIRRRPLVGLTVTDDARGVQLRITGTARVIEDDAERARAWATFGPQTRHLYASPLTPGSRLADNEQAESEDDDSAAFDRFAWVGIDLDRLDWLDISTPQHERWQFSRDGRSWSGRQIAP